MEEKDREDTFPPFDRETVTCQGFTVDAVELATVQKDAGVPVPRRDAEFVTFEKDLFGNLRCRDYRPHHVYKGKIVLTSETEAWKVTLRMTAKEQRNGTFNPDYPLGPYVCPAHKHYHIGHDPTNVGRTPSRMIRFQLLIDDGVRRVEKIKRQTRNRIKYWQNRVRIER